MNSLDKNTEEYIQKISDSLWITRCSRWNAFRRLKNQSQLSVFSISLLSVFGIAVPIIQIFIDSSKCYSINKLYTLVSILLSIFILVLSILEGSKNHNIKAEILKNNAIEISSLHKKIKFLNYRLKQVDCEEKQQKIIRQIVKYYEKYDDSIKLCPENHETEDYLLFQAQKYKDFDKEWLWSIRICIWLRIKYYWLYFTLVIIIAIIVSNLYLSCPI